MAGHVSGSIHLWSDVIADLRPIRPVEIIQLPIVPADFFTANPAIDVTSSRNKASVLVNGTNGVNGTHGANGVNGTNGANGTNGVNGHAHAACH